MPTDKEEKLRASVTGLFCGYGYERYRPARFESYEVYRRNKDYIDGDRIITFTDSTGKLLALRPDVTLSIINDLPTSGGVRKYFYDESVFRRDGDGEYRDLRQIGVEYVGGADLYPECEIAALAVKTLELLGGDCVLTVGNMDVAEALIKPLGLTDDEFVKVLSCIRRKAFHELKKLLGGNGADKENAERLLRLTAVEGEADAALAEAYPIVVGNAQAKRAADELRELTEALKKCGYADKIRLDFSLIDDFRYYNGAVFRGYARGAAKAVIRGGRYDNMLKRMGKPGRAVGFALDFDAASSLMTEAAVKPTIIDRQGLSIAEALAAAERVAASGGCAIVCEGGGEGEER